VAGVLKFIGTLGNDVESPEDVYVKGFVASVTEAFSTQFGNATFTIKEEKDGEASPIFTFYRGLYLGNKKWTANDTQIAVGDEVIICGRVVNFKGNTPETKRNEAYIYSINGETQGSGGGGNEGGGQGGQTTAVYKKVTSIVSGQKYVLLGSKSDKYYVATPLASDKTYGRLNGKEASLSNDQLSGDWASYEFTFTETEGGYTIAMPDGRLLAVDSEHDGTFQIGESYDHVFTVSYSDNQFKIAHKSTGKTIYHGGGTYTNFSCSKTVPDDGTMPMIFGKTE